MVKPSRGPGQPAGDLFGDPGGMPAQVHRLFFAVLPDAAARARMAAVADSLKPTYAARWLDPSRYHVTLHFLGDHAALRNDLVDGAMAAAARVRHPGFECAMDRVGSFHGAQPPCVLQAAQPQAALQGLWEDLRLALAAAGQGVRTGRGFVAHVTLGYGRGAMLPAAAVDPVAWAVREFVLIHRVVGQPGWDILGTWNLAGGA